jgi:ABC-2 type transport system permease protein
VTAAVPTETSGVPAAGDDSAHRGDHHGSTAGVAFALGVRSIINVFRVPGAVVPTLVMPIFFLTAFSGSFSGVTHLPTFPTHTIQNWVMPYAILQGSAFAGMSAVFSVARDIEGPFYDRLLLAPVPRRALLLGPVIAALLRALIPVVFVSAVGMAAGGRLAKGPLGFVTMLIAAEGVAVLACLWGLGIVYRFKSQRSLALVQVGIFSAMFLSASQMPVHLIDGWLRPVARLNPMTNILRLAREGFLPGGVSWGDTYGGLLALLAAALLLGWFATSGLRRLTP